MKKITFFFVLMITSLGFSQTNLEDFEGTPPAFMGFEGLGGAALVADPTDGTNTVLEMISVDSGNPWQGAEVLMQDNYIDMSTTMTVEVDVYSTQAFDLFGKVENGQAGAVDSATATPYTAVGTWETITLTFNQSLDGTAPANGEYEKFVLFLNWNIGINGWNNPLDATANFTVYFDNITAFAGAPVGGGGATCTDGMQNQGETGVDCGGPCNACPPATAAPIPTVADGNAYAIYNDTNMYSSFLGFDYDFGDALFGEPNLDTGGGNNIAYQFDFSDGGYGFGEGGPDDVSAYDFVSFDYWAVTGTPGFRFVLISNAPDGRAVTEHIYQIGDVAGSADNEDIVEGTWTKVVIPMSYFTNDGFSSAHLFQWKVDAYFGDAMSGGEAFVDNILFSIGNPLSVNDFDTAEFSVYPNPTKNNWNIKSSIDIESVVIYDILGKRVTRLTPNSNEVEISTTNINSGVYFAKIESANGSKTIKLIKE